MVPAGGRESKERVRVDRVVAIRAQVEYVNTKKRNPLIGCTRRGLWTQEDKPDPFEIQRTALLSSFADHHTVHTPVGPIGVWLYDMTVVQVYGGDLRSWWEWDLWLEWCLVQAYSGYSLRPFGYIVQLVGPRMTFYCHNMHGHEDTAKDMAGAIVQEANADPPGRIAKNDQRAYIACKRCPVKLECDTLDAVTPQGKADWGRSYPFP